jgi:ATP-binding cassette subfamily F protein 3
VLSGGEKSRVALAKTLISEANFLLLDEPTNHLDFISENILIQALQQYKGSFVVVSHNRHFVSQVANKIWYIENKEIKEYPGTFEEYEYWKKKITTTTPEPSKPEKKSEPQAPKPKPVQTPSNEAKLKSLEKELKKIEADINQLETLKASLENELTQPEVYNHQDKLKDVQTKFNHAISSLADANKKWEDLATRIDELSV